MLSEAAQGLIRDVFQKEHLFRDPPRIRKRVVAWGPDAAVVELDHSAVIVSEEELLDVLGCEEAEGGDADWTIVAARPLPAETTEHRFGSRVAMPVEVKLKVAGDTCWMESVEDGWLFLNAGWLIAVGGRPEDLLEQSRMVAEQIESFEAASGAVSVVAADGDAAGGRRMDLLRIGGDDVRSDLRGWDGACGAGGDSGVGGDAGGRTGGGREGAAGAL